MGNAHEVLICKGRELAGKSVSISHTMAWNSRLVIVMPKTAKTSSNLYGLGVMSCGAPVSQH